MDDSFKKLNGPTADGIQSDYIAKEKRAAEELLNLQLGNAKKLADLRSKLLGKLMDEAKEEGKLVEDYLAEYGLQKRLDALASELEAEKKARLGQLNTLDELRKTNSEALAATEEAAAKKQASRQAKESAARKAALEAQHKTELANIQALNKARKNLTTPELTAGLTLEDTDLQANVSAELDLDSSGLENLTAELAVSPDIADITLPEAELSVKPHVADVVIPDAEIAVKAKVEFDPEIPKEVEISAKVIPEVRAIEDLTANAVVQPQLADLPKVPDLESNLKLISETPEIEDLTANLKLATEVGSLPELESQLKLTPEIKAIEPLELGAKIIPQLEGDLEVPELSATLKTAPIVEPITDLEATAKVTPIIDPITGLEADLKLATSVEPIQDLEAKLKLAAEVESIAEQTASLKLTPEITEPLQLEPQTVDVTLNTNLENLKLEAQSADLTLTPNVEALPDLAASLKLTPEVEELSDLTATLKVSPEVSTIELPEAELQVKPTIAPINSLEADLKLVASVEPVEDQVANLKLSTVLDQIPDQEGKLLVTPEVVETLPELTADLTVTPVVLPVEPLSPMDLEVVPVVPTVEVGATIKTKAEDLQNLTAPLLLVPEVGSVPSLTTDVVLAPDLSNLENLETTIKATVETELPEINISNPTAESSLIEARLAGIKKIQDEELDLLSLRQEIESELINQRVSSLDLLQDRLSNLTGATTTLEVANPEIINSSVDTLREVFDGFLSEFNQAIINLQEGFDEAESQFVQSRNKDLKTDSTSSTESASTPKVKQPHSPKKGQSLGTEESNEGAWADYYSKEIAAYEKLLADKDRLSARHAKQQQNTLSQERLTALKAQTELYLLNLTTQAELEERFEQQKVNSAIDARVALEKKKQELARVTLAAQDETYLKEEALAELEATRVDAAIKAKNAEIAKQKALIKEEENLKTIRLQQASANVSKKLKTDDPEKAKEFSTLVADPEALQAKGAELARANLTQEVNDEYSARGIDEGKEAEALQAAEAEAQASGDDTGLAERLAAIKAEFAARREEAAAFIAWEQGQNNASIAEYYALKQQQDAALQQAAEDADSRKKDQEAADHKTKLKRFLELNPAVDKGVKAAKKTKEVAGNIKDEGLVKGIAKSVKDSIGNAFANLQADIMAENPELSAEEAKQKANEKAQEKLDKAMEAAGNLLNQLASTGKSSTKHQSGVDTRLQGLSTDEKSGGIKKKAGSYWRSLAADIGKLGASPFFLQETAEERFAKLISQGIAFNVKERAFLDVLKDKVATTFNVADGTLLKLVRIQQADTSAARLGMESALTEFLNSMYATTEYMQQAAESIRSNLYEASALMGAKEATEFEFQVQKWMGSLYSVGFSNTEGLSAALGKIAAGDISGVTDGGLGNLLVMAANEAGKPIAEILEKGLTASETDELLKSVVNYLSKLYTETQGSRVLAQQFANVYGVTASDLRAAATLAPSVKDITKYNEDFGTMIQQVYDSASFLTMTARTSTGEMMENMKANFMYSMASTLANSPVLSSLNLVANLLNDLVGGIEIPFVNVMGFGFDLNASVADLMNVAALSGSVLGGIGKMIAGLANLNPTNLLKTFGVEKGTAGLDVQSRGAAAGLTGATAGGSGQSESGYIGNESGDDVKDKTISDASSGPESTVAEAKEDQENKEEARAQMIAGHIVDIYELLQEVTQGTKKFRVQLDVGTNPLSWAGGTWS